MAAIKVPPLVVEGTEGKKLISNSSRSGFTFCPRSFELEVLQGLKRRVTERPFGFGHAMHEALELHYRGASLADVLSRIQAWREEAAAKVSACPDPGYTVEDLDADAALVTDMVTRYVEAFPDDLERYEVLAVEQPFIVPIGQRLANGTLRTDATYAYAGVFDLVVRDRRTRQVFVVDHKSTVSTDLASFEADVEAAGSGQRIGYVYAARFFWPETVGIVYNVLRKKAPARIATVQCKKCKGVGCAACGNAGYAGISKTCPDTTLALFDAELADLRTCNPGMSSENVDEVRAQLAERVGRKGRFLYRFEVPVASSDIEEWMADVYEVAHAMGRALKDGRWYRNLSACNVNGRKCRFLRICLRGCDDAENWERKPRDPFIPGEVFKSNDNEEV